MNRDPLISIVIPVKNGAKWLESLFQSLKRQTLAERVEIICIDSGSVDGSIGVIKQQDVRLINVSPEEFNHGLTRNLGVQAAKGEYVAMTVQDARPANDEWLQQLLDGFTGERIAGVCGQQVVPHDKDKNPVQWFRPLSEPKLEEYQFDTPEAFDNLTSDAKKKICGWDDVTACYRREALLKVPFREINFGEDAAWAMDALRAGYKIVYNKKAQVYHYHNEYTDFAFKRALTVFYHRYKLFGLIPSVPTVSLRRKMNMAKILLKSPVSFLDKIKWWKYNLDLAGSQKKAYNTFISSLEKGEEKLDAVHQKYCGQPPQANQLGP